MPISIYRHIGPLETLPLHSSNKALITFKYRYCVYSVLFQEEKISLVHSILDLTRKIINKDISSCLLFYLLNL